MVGTSKSAIYRYEHGNSRIWPSLLSAMASALRCRISDLLAPLDMPLPDVKFRRRIKSAAAHASGSTLMAKRRKAKAIEDVSWPPWDWEPPDLREDELTVLEGELAKLDHLKAKSKPKVRRTPRQPVRGT